MSTMPAMSNTPQPPQAPVLPFFLAVQQHLTAVAANTAAGLAAVQSDLSQGQKLQAVNDAVATAAANVAEFLPSQSANINAALGLFITGENIVKSIVALFHHPAAIAALPQPPAPPAS